MKKNSNKALYKKTYAISRSIKDINIAKIICTQISKLAKKDPSEIELEQKLDEIFEGNKEKIKKLVLLLADQFDFECEEGFEEEPWFSEMEDVADLTVFVCKNIERKMQAN